MALIVDSKSSPRLVFHEQCWGCSRPLNVGEKRFAFLFFDSISRCGPPLLHAHQCCNSCANHDEAIQEAKDLELRFTQVETMNERCACGAVSHSLLGCCIPCSRNERMLSKAQAEAKLMTNALKELRREIKIQRKTNDTAN